jgi:hypothetical protein
MAARWANIAFGVGTDQRRVPVVVHRTEHVVIGEQVIEAEVLGRLADAPHGLGITAELDLRIDDTDLHRLTLPRTPGRVTGCFGGRFPV